MEGVSVSFGGGGGGGEPCRVQDGQPRVSGISISEPCVMLTCAMPQITGAWMQGRRSLDVEMVCPEY